MLDWSLVGDAVEFLSQSIGRTAAIVAVVAAVLLAAAVLVFTALAALRLTRLMVTHRAPAIRAVAMLSVLWAALAALGIEVAPDQPAAARSMVVPAYERALQVVASLRDKAAFARESSVDPVAATPGSRLLTGSEART